jgi:hypothetical protein
MYYLAFPDRKMPLEASRLIQTGKGVLAGPGSR